MAAESLGFTVSAAVLARECVYHGVTVYETAGSAATVLVYDNATTNSGTLLETVKLAANGSYTSPNPSGGLHARNGIYVNVTGTVAGSVRHG